MEGLAKILKAWNEELKIFRQGGFDSPNQGGLLNQRKEKAEEAKQKERNGVEQLAGYNREEHSILTASESR